MSASSKADLDIRRRAGDAYARMALRFERTAPGDGRPQFVARGAGYAVDLANGNATVIVGPAADQRSIALGLRLAGASTVPAPTAGDILTGVTNYLIGNDPRQWRTGVRSYAKVEYRDVYPGVDVTYYGTQRQLEYDFIVAPGASHRAIAMEFDGATSVRIDPTGNLVLGTEAGSLVQRAPVIYQERNGKREAVRGGYVRLSRNRVGFRVGKHDSQLPLVIDPVLDYATYLGGGLEERTGGVAVDAQGSIYVAGMTGSANFPANGPAAMAHGQDRFDAFVVKLTATGNQLEYATYLGGGNFEEATDVDVDSYGNAYVIGTTYSHDFPTIHAIQSTSQDWTTAFVAKLDPTGAVVYSTYLGSAGEIPYLAETVSTSGDGIAVDASGRAYVSGWTRSLAFPIVNALQSSLSGNPVFRTSDRGSTWLGLSNGLSATAVVTLLIDPRDPSTVYAGTYLDGVFKTTDRGATWTRTANLPPRRVNALAIGPNGTLYAGNDLGLYRSHDGGASWTDLQLGGPVFTLAVDERSGAVYLGSFFGAYKSTDEGNAWIDTGSGLNGVVYSLALSQSVLYAGTANGVFKNIDGTAWQSTTPYSDWNVPLQSVISLSVNRNNANDVWAGTNSGLFHTTSGGAEWLTDPALWGAMVYTVAIAPSAPATIYAGTSWGSGVTEDGGTTWRQTGGTNWCFVIDPMISTVAYAGTFTSWDLFVSRISADGSTLDYSTYLGGTGDDWASDIATDSSGAAYVAGTTFSTDFPVRNPFQATAGDLMDVVVAKLSESGGLTYATYLGGSGSDYYPRLAVDASGQAHVVGLTFSQNFPTANAFQPSHGGGYSDVFVTTLNQAGNGLVFSTFLGGSDQEVDSTQSLGPAVAVGPTGETMVTGVTRSRNFPTHDAIQSAHAGGMTDAFVARFDSAGRLWYSSYLGGSGDDSGRRIAADPAGAVVVAGATSSTNFPTQHAIQSTNAGAADVFVVRIACDTAAVDTIVPATMITPSGISGSNGWYRSAVQIALTAVDDCGGSGIAFTEYSVNGGAFQRYAGTFSVGAEGTTVVRARSTDNAGNVENPVAAVSIAIDTAAPAIGVNSPAATEYLHSDTLQLVFAATDSRSGVASGSPTATLDGVAVSNGQTIQLLILSLGTHTLAVSATDQAGNGATANVQFGVKATIDSLIAAVNTFKGSGQIDAQIAGSLLMKLSDAKKVLDRGNVWAAGSKLRDFRDQVSAQAGRGIAVAAAQVLLADVDYVLGAI
jgi:hypothetical protein